MSERGLLEALAARCEREVATWQLDDAIAQAAFGLPPCGTAGPRPYTFSIDAAVTLVPEGFAWGVERHVDNVLPWAYCHEGDGSNHVAKTPPLALCAAALRARAALAGNAKQDDTRPEGNPPS